MVGNAKLLRTRTYSWHRVSSAIYFYSKLVELRRDLRYGLNDQLDTIMRCDSSVINNAEFFMAGARPSWRDEGVVESVHDDRYFSWRYAAG